MMVTLEVPESSKNRDLGMFVIAVKMFDRNGLVTFTSERSTMLQYRSIILRVIDFLGWLPLYFFGLKEHKQTLSVMMFSHLVDDYYHPSVGALVEIRSHGLDLYSCMLTLSANFTGLKYYLHYWPVTSAMFAFWSNMTVLALALGITMFKRNAEMKVLAATLNLANGKKVAKERSKKEGFEDVDEDYNDESIEKNVKETSARTTSSTQTGPSDTQKTIGKKDFEELNMPVIQEPVDFIPEGMEGEAENDFVTELRHRRIN
ncbi:seipin [Elysia marginata]|uniref:Seipin n=1 Tax=Elysia marginata TaxID=1093978 RepID=A0AAV4H450_9GAST|nr:seipin [Elysia marginata]